MIFGKKTKTKKSLIFDPCNMFLDIAKNIPEQHKTGFGVTNGLKKENIQ